MKRDITRKHFLHLGLGATAAAVLLPACGGDDSDTGAGTDDPSSGTDPSATDPSATDPSATDPSATDPSATDPSATDPSATDPSTGPDPSATDPSTGPEPTTGAVDTTDGETTTGSPAGCTADPAAEFSDHDHTLTVPLADIEAGVEAVYQAGGAHNHTVTLTAEDFATLLETGTVQVQSSFDGHMHTVTLTCP